MADLWDELFPVRPHRRPPGSTEMLRLLAYDIADPKRLRRVANVCEDYGVRVQRSLFECWLEDDEFARLWEKLLAEVDLKEDQLVAYRLEAQAARERLTAGQTMQCTEEEHFLYVGSA